MTHYPQLHISASHSLGVILGCIIVLLIINYRHVPTHYRELTVGGLLGMATGILIIFFRFTFNRLSASWKKLTA
ncbi:hypothetical protein [Spirosoma aerophilum]